MACRARPPCAIAAPPPISWRVRTASTYFVGGGPDNGTPAVSAAFNDVISNLPFATAFRNGHWEQLGMGGASAGTVIQAATALNQAMYTQVFVAADFGKDRTAIGPVVAVPHAPSAAAAPISTVAAPAGKLVTLSGQVVNATMTANGHIWNADGAGLFHTGNLAAEWTGYYAQMLAGNGASLTAAQRQAGNAEAVFEATGLTKLSAAAQQTYREDAQRQIDAMAEAARITAAALNIPAQATLLPGAFIPLERTLHDNAALEELAVQGFGLTGMAGTRYAGYANDFKTSTPR